MRSQRFTISLTDCRRGATARTHPPPHLQVLGSGKPRLSDSLAQNRMPRGHRPQEVRRGRPLAPSCFFQPPTTRLVLNDGLADELLCRQGSWVSWLHYLTADAGRKQIARPAADEKQHWQVMNFANFRRVVMAGCRYSDQSVLAMHRSDAVSCWPCCSRRS